MLITDQFLFFFNNKSYKLSFRAFTEANTKYAPTRQAVIKRQLKGDTNFKTEFLLSGVPNAAKPKKEALVSVQNSFVFMENHFVEVYLAD